MPRTHKHFEIESLVQTSVQLPEFARTCDDNGLVQHKRHVSIYEGDDLLIPAHVCEFRLLCFFVVLSIDLVQDFRNELDFQLHCIVC
jgi:hypothetical protein